MSKIKGIIFDLDDTLYNEIDYVKSGYRKVATYLESFVDKTIDEIFNLLMNRFNEDRNNVFNYVLENIGIDEHKVLMECLEVYRNQEPDIEIESETRGLLLELKKEYKLGIITDGRPEGQWAKIRALGLEEVMDAIIVTDELGGIEYRKPHELPYLTIATRLQLPLHNLVYIGDNEKKDFVAARRLGMYTMQINNGDGLYKSEQMDQEYKAHKQIESVKYIVEELRNII